MILCLSIPMYWVLLWAASRRKRAYPLLFRFLEGIILAFLCFVFLPPAFLEQFLCAGVGAIIGIAFAVWMEGKYSQGGLKKELGSGIIFLVAFLFQIFFREDIALPRSAVGGMALYCTCTGLFPEGMPLKNTLQSALGGMLGFLLGVAICFA
ncbi:hypothetical protein CLNEO_00020 [Anaerotignum neopropionicum]|mgnify:CR=1 FL=1|uniref:Uncharacterized protein n=1 Tax=Anaerotignum neopropionicum TaxID=36847 RepID=A0A136WHQ5_9FIRM|nr:hypothetical protein [Anaerotignum neopropionicum]KXL53910.1 hypothetical protein CLNEO_00020 [Anaerotignum neopropionicum]